MLCKTAIRSHVFRRHRIPQALRHPGFMKLPMTIRDSAKCLSPSAEISMSSPCGSTLGNAPPCQTPVMNFHKFSPLRAGKSRFTKLLERSWSSKPSACPVSRACFKGQYGTPEGAIKPICVDVTYFMKDRISKMKRMQL